MSDGTIGNVKAMCRDDSGAPTAPLAEFRQAYEDDDNWWWRISCGHHMNLFDAACEEIDSLRSQLAESQQEVARLNKLRLVGSCPCDCHEGPSHCDRCCQHPSYLCVDCKATS